MNRRDDRIDDLFRQNPDASVTFLRALMYFGLCYVLIMVWPILAILHATWHYPSEGNWSLRAWIGMQLVLQGLQVPLRKKIHNKLMEVTRARSRREASNMLNELSHSYVWHANQKIGLLVYVWFVLGIVIVWRERNTQTTAPNLYKLCVALIVTLIVRLALTFAWFYYMFGSTTRETHQGTIFPVGATESQLASLPVSKYNKYSHSHVACCAICLEDFLEGDCVLILHCDHIYHDKCAKSWLKLKKVCPLCQQDIDESKPGKSRVD